MREDIVHEQTEFERYSRRDGKPMYISHSGCDVISMRDVFYNPSSGVEIGGQWMNCYCWHSDEN